MAQNGSPAGSPTMPPIYAAMKARTRSLTPPAIPSKRDKRRAMLSERLNEMIGSFEGNHVDHYVAQLSAIQCDINLIMRADPYKNGPLEDAPEAINRLVDDARRETSRSRQFSAEAEETFEALKGKHYSRFVDEVNEAMERRDADLTMAHYQYEQGIEELHRVHQFRKTLAHEEHQLLSKTIRERLIQTVTQKKARLLRDKEQLDIADSNALLLNPNQFSIGNPASPGGPQNGRKTRHTRLRPAEGAEDVGAAGQDGRKGKKKTAMEENDHESPTPFSRMIDSRVLTPYRDARAKIIHSQYEAPLFSVDRLFSEKELALNLNKAHMITSELLVRSQMQVNGSVGTSRSLDQEIIEPVVAAAPATDTGEGPDVDAQTADASMLLNLFPHATSATGHATRSTIRTTANPLSDLASVATAVAPFPPVQISATSGKSGPPHAPSWPGLSEAEIQNDLALMRLDPSDPIIVKLTERCREKQGPYINPEQWRVAPGADGEEQTHMGPGTETGILVPGANMAAISMMRQSSGMGMVYGGVPMSRNTSMMSDGGMGGGVNTADFGMRTRGRI